jgi:hypothetical protein
MAPERTSVLGVDEGADAAAPLGLGDDVEGERGLAGRLRAVDLHHAATRHAADPERDVEPERARGQRLDLLDGAILAELHDGALAELLLDLADGQVDGPLSVHVDSHFTPSSTRDHLDAEPCTGPLADPSVATVTRPSRTLQPGSSTSCGMLFRQALRRPARSA